MNRLDDHRHELLAEWTKMSLTWETVRSRWRDQARRDFEKQFWDPLENQTRAYLEALEALCEKSRDV